MTIAVPTTVNGKSGISKRSAVKSVGIEDVGFSRTAGLTGLELAEMLALPTTGQGSVAPVTFDKYVNAVNLALQTHAPNFDPPPDKSTVAWTFAPWKVPTTFDVERRHGDLQAGSVNYGDWEEIANDLSTMAWSEHDVDSLGAHRQYRITPKTRAGDAQQSVFTFGGDLTCDAEIVSITKRPRGFYQITYVVTATGGSPPYVGAGTKTATKSAGLSGTITGGVTAGGSLTCQYSVDWETPDPPAGEVTCSAQVTGYEARADGRYNVLVAVTASGGTPPYNPGPGTGRFPKDGSTSGTITGGVRDNEGRTCAWSVAFTTPAPPLTCSAEVTGYTYLGNNNYRVNYSVTAEGGSAPYTGTGALTATKAASTSGTLTGTVTDDDGATCNYSVAYTTPAPPPPPITCSARITGYTRQSNGNYWVNYTVTSTGVPPVLGVGNKRVNRGPGRSGTITGGVTDANGSNCQYSVSYRTPDPPPPVNFRCSGRVNSITRRSDGRYSVSITYSASGGTPPYSGTGTGTFVVPAGVTRTGTWTMGDAAGRRCTATVTYTTPSS